MASSIVRRKAGPRIKDGLLSCPLFLRTALLLGALLGLFPVNAAKNLTTDATPLSDDGCHFN